MARRRQPGGTPHLRRRRGPVGLIVAALLVTACSAGSPAETAERADATAPPAGRPATGTWSLDALDPGGRLLQLSAPHGGCRDYEGLEVDEGTDAVTLTVRLRDTAADADGCHLDLRFEAVVVRLDAPLGDRALRGCGRADCREVGAGDSGGWWTVPPVAVEGERSIALADDRRMAALDADDGTLRWRTPAAAEARAPDGFGVAGDLLLVAVGDRVTAHATSDGRVRWEVPARGTHPAFGRRPFEVAGDLLAGSVPDVVANGSPFGPPAIAVRRRDDATLVWGRQPEEGDLVEVRIAGDLLLVVSVIRPSDGINRSSRATTVVSAADLATGERRWTTRLAGEPNALAIADDVAVVGVWAARYGLDLASGAQRWSDLPTPNARLLAGRDGLLVVDDRGAVRTLDHATGATAPASARVPPGAVLTDDLVIVVGEGGRVEASDARTGEARWDADVGALASAPARVGEVLVLATPLGAVALDAATGAHRWSWADEELVTER